MFFIREPLNKDLKEPREWTKELCETVVFKVYCASKLLGGLVKTWMAPLSAPGFLIQ